MGTRPLPLYNQSENFVLKKSLFSAFQRQKQLKVSDLTVNKCPKERGKMTRSNRALYQAYNCSKVSRLCINKLDWHTDLKRASETLHEALQSPRNCPCNIGGVVTHGYSMGYRTFYQGSSACKIPLGSSPQLQDCAQTGSSMEQRSLSTGHETLHYHWEQRKVLV